MLAAVPAEVEACLSLSCLSCPRQSLSSPSRSAMWVLVCHQALTSVERRKLRAAGALTTSVSLRVCDRQPTSELPLAFG